MNDKDLIAQIASQHLGAPPPQAAPQGVPPGAPPQGAVPPGPPPSPPKADPSPTDIEKAQAKVAPKDPGAQDSASDEGVRFIKVGDREYTESQLQGMLTRYPQANSKIMMNKPVLDLVDQLMGSAKSNGYDAKPEEVAGLLKAAVEAFTKDPQFGNKQGQPENRQGSAKPAMSASDEPDGQGDVEAAFERWEKENAVKLPPGFKDMSNQNKALASQVQQLTAMMQQLVQGAQGGAAQVVQGASQQLAQAQSLSAEASTRMITTNLNNAFAQANVPVDPQTRRDFQMFAAQRGYDFPDFMDSDMTKTVVGDFIASRNSPEFQRLKQVMERRQAFTGSVEGAPGTSGAAPAQGGDPILAGLVSSAMQKRGMA